ncbi:MAG: hypothetical protein JO270_04835 [Acidobacteriaceae bacterium]|nr:hypothetical protein [Acidobacteriaceae bacterium]
MRSPGLVLRVQLELAAELLAAVLAQRPLAVIAAVTGAGWCGCRDDVVVVYDHGGAARPKAAALVTGRVEEGFHESIPFSESPGPVRPENLQLQLWNLSVHLPHNKGDADARALRLPERSRCQVAGFQDVP